MSGDEICRSHHHRPERRMAGRAHRSLVEGRLAACGRNIAAIGSIYRWQGAIDDEARVALHTRRDLADAIVARAERDHPYDVPCVIALSIASGNPPYLNWVRAGTRQVDG
jgi:periplasmic divalent cation tolerance protein